MIKIEEDFYVSGQIGPEGLSAAREAGIETIINNRPNGEEQDQPRSDVLGVEAGNLGLGYYWIPVFRDIDAESVAEFSRVLAATEGPVLAFCRSGARSTMMWALSRVASGARGADAVLEKARAAGYDLSHLAALLHQLEESAATAPGEG